jgi:hypothetical protein
MPRMPASITRAQGRFRAQELLHHLDSERVVAEKQVADARDEDPHDVLPSIGTTSSGKK